MSVANLVGWECLGWRLNQICFDGVVQMPQQGRGAVVLFPKELLAVGVLADLIEDWWCGSTADGKYVTPSFNENGWFLKHVFKKHKKTLVFATSVRCALFFSMKTTCF